MSTDRLLRLAKKVAHQVAYEIEAEASQCRQAGRGDMAQFLAELAVTVHRKADENGYPGGVRE